MKILTDSSDIRDFINRFGRRLAETDVELPEETAKRIREIFGEDLSASEVARRIVGDVERGGDSALIEYTKKIDGVELSPSDLRVAEDEIRKASSAIPKELAGAIDSARDNITRFQEGIVPECPPPTGTDGAKISLNIVPLSSAGINAPAGEAPHPSTVLMCAVPASVAGVKRIVVVTPPSRDGSVNPSILAACAACGVNEVYRVGGAQAIAALACGTETIPRVDKVVGPGNIFVTLAKKEIYGRAGIEMLAGPTEVVIVADESARVDFIAADMLAQAEHGPMCAAVLVTTSSGLAEEVQRELETQVKTLERRGVAEAALAGSSAIIVVEDEAAAIETANELAPEHLGLMLKNASDAAGKIRNAGAVFVGPYTPEALGDYSAGPSHVLPTGGSARFSSGLSVYDFYRRFCVMEFSKDALRKQADTIRQLACTEGLTGHLRSLEIRIEG